MSYRSRSYRKMSRAVKKAGRKDGLPPDLARHEMDRVLHWSNQPPLPKPPEWGRPRWAFERLPDVMSRAAQL